MTFIKTRLALLTLSWALILIWAIFSLTVSIYRYTLPFSTVFALLWTGVCVIYTLVASTTQENSLNPVIGTMAVRVVLGLLPVVIATLLFLVGGILGPHQSRGQKRPKHGFGLPC